MKPIFVTGTDTGVGKSRVAVALLTALAARGVSVAGMKPVASGCARSEEGLRNEDALALLAASSVRLRYEDVNPYAFEPAIAPHLAAAEVNQAIGLPVLERAYERLALRADRVVVEGAGGWLTPLSEQITLADFAIAIDSAVVLVVGLRLGCINHALLTARTVRNGGLDLVGWVANAIDPDFERRDANIRTLTRWIPAPCLGVLPHEPGAGPSELAAALRVDLL